MLGNSGICRTDEFGGMSEANRNVLHDMMEQQTLGIARRALSASCSPAPSCLLSAFWSPWGVAVGDWPPPAAILCGDTGRGHGPRPYDPPGPTRDRP